MSELTGLGKTLDIAVSTVKQEALLRLTQELVAALEREGFQVADLVQALAHYTSAEPRWDKGNSFLLEAAREFELNN